MGEIPTAVIADDDEAQLEGLTTMVSDMGYRVFACRSFDEAYRALIVEHPKVFITDVRLAGRNGLQLAHLAGERYPDVTRIVLTAFDDIDLRREAVRMGARFLLKPLRKMELTGLLGAGAGQSAQ
jgi:DNA-binding NtrC family response regulator